MMEELILDGSMGEGGGQILRSALSLSLITGRAARIENIRALRPKPGLLRQHLAAVRAAAAIGAEVEGAELGSPEITIRPGQVEPGEHRFVIGSAGSACLVLQTVLPPLLTASGPSRITIEGGTHNPFAPPFDFIERVFLPQINRMGPIVRAQIERLGFFPAGGGEIVVEIEPCEKLGRLDLMERASEPQLSARAIFANLPAKIAQRELETVRRKLHVTEDALQIHEDMTSRGPGNAVFVEATFDGGSEICTGFAERGVRAEKVAARAVSEMKRFLDSDAPVGVRLADQLMIPLAMAGGGRFRTPPLSKHSQTNIEVIQRFLDTKIEVAEFEHFAELRFGKSLA